jgi:hypothetical protein
VEIMRTNASNAGRHVPALLVLAQLCFALAVWTVASALHAAPTFKCVDTQGRVAYRDTPCPAHARQTRIELHAQPTIGDADEVVAARARVSVPRHPRTATHSRRHFMRRRRAKSRMSWECRAADGEVFYRHTRCPSSIPGDGIARTAYTEKQSRERTRSRHDAWGRVRVHGEKIPRAEACRRIHSAGAAGRDGHLRDADVSTYDHLMGRDPCTGM